MNRRGFRRIGRSAQEELRRRAVFLVEHDGLTQAEAARVVGVEAGGEYLAEASSR
jgi:DNA-directed RNA polymerase specialized sigma24 family protein